VIRARAGAACAVLITLVPQPAASQGGGRWTAFGGIGFLEERVDASFGLEKFSGLALEFGVTARVSSRLAVDARGLGAELPAASAEDLDRRVGEAEALARYRLASVWGLYGGVTVRSISNDAGGQHWVVGRVGAEVRPAFSGGRLHAIGRFGLIPLASVKGLSSAAITFDGAVGFAYEHDRINLSLLYGVEQFAFTDAGDVDRKEQMSRLMLRGGIRLPR